MSQKCEQFSYDLFLCSLLIFWDFRFSFSLLCSYYKRTVLFTPARQNPSTLWCSSDCSQLALFECLSSLGSQARIRAERVAAQTQTCMASRKAEREQRAIRRGSRKKIGELGDRDRLVQPRTRKRYNHSLFVFFIGWR